MVGVGSRQLSDKTYSGIFRRETAEGYGQIAWSNGDVYIGQVREGYEYGYGITTKLNGQIQVGYHRSRYPTLGIAISANKDRLLVGVHQWNGLAGFGRQIGLRNGLDSFSAFWIDGKPSEPIQQIPEIYFENAARLAEYPEKHNEYLSLARPLASQRDALDREFVDSVGSYL